MLRRHFAYSSAKYCWCVQLYEDLYWQNYDDMESNRIELAKQAKREARLAAEAANKEEDLEMPIELQQGSGFPGLAARVRIPSGFAHEICPHFLSICPLECPSAHLMSNYQACSYANFLRPWRSVHMCSNICAKPWLHPCMHVLSYNLVIVAIETYDSEGDSGHVYPRSPLLRRTLPMPMSKVGQETMPMVCNAQAVGWGAMHLKGVGDALLGEESRCEVTWVWGHPWLLWVVA